MHPEFAHLLGAPGRSVGWGLTRDARFLHLALRLRSALGGLALADALRAVAEEPGGLRPWGLGGFLRDVERAADAVEDGAGLAEALAGHARLREWELALLADAEAGGRLQPGLDAWIEALRVRAVSRRIAPEQWSYVLSVLLLAVFCASMFSWKVMPTLATILTSAGAAFPPVTSFALRLLNLAGGVVPLLLLAGLALGAGALLLQVSGPGGRRVVDGFLLRRPGPRAVARVLGLRAAAAALGAGADEASAFRLAGEVQPRPGACAAWEELARIAEEGGPLVTAPPVLGGIPFARNLDRALRGDDTPDRLRRLADAELNRWWRGVSRRAALTEPLLVAGLGALLGVVITGAWAAIHAMSWVVQP